MGCCGDRERVIHETQKWDYINLSDFRARSCWTPFTYGALYIALIISIACYIIDLLIVIQLLIFERWAGRVEPKVPFYITRWVFLGCILASWVFLAYRWWKAIRAIKTGGIAESYLDPLAVRLQSIRVGSGRGWRRFLVFAEMTKGKKGVDYLALFTHFSFEAWYRIIFAEGPRNVINAMTLYAIFTADLINKDGKSLSGPLQFFNNIKELADGDWLRAAVLFGMLFVLIKWTLSAISLLLAVFFYGCFLWHQIPKSDRTLGAYCRRKVDVTLSRIVDKKVTKALNKADAAFNKSQTGRGRAGESIANIKKAPTLPILSPNDDDKLQMMPLSRTTTMNSQPPPYGADRQPTLPNFEPEPRPFMNRSATNHSTSSYSSNSPLIGDASPMGYAIPRSNTPGQFSARPSPHGPMPLASPQSSGQPSPRPLPRSNTGLSSASGGSWGPATPSRLNNGFGAYAQGRSSPAPPRSGPIQEFEMRSQTPQSNVRANTSSPFGYAMPNRSLGSPVYPPNHPPPRNFQSPLNGQARGSPAPSGYSGSIYDHY